MKERLVLRKLTYTEIVSTYIKYLFWDFPAEERRPLLMILNSAIHGYYECLGAFYKERQVGYAFFVKIKKHYLMDYLAVVKNYRGKGIGSAILNEIRCYYQAAASVICEVENPDYAENESDRNTRQRRLDFYYKNGCHDTKVRTWTFGVRFILLEIKEKTLEKEKVGRLYHLFYKKTLPKEMYRKNIKTYVL